LHKSYSFSTQPNYSYSDRSNDNTSLTDGIYTTGNFWTQSTTVGWQSAKEVSINLDLGKVIPIATVSFNTVRSIRSHINFPQNIFVFISNDNTTFRYVGDAADDPQNLPGENEAKKFILDSIGQSARYVTLTIIPQGSYIFCDEIEVLKGKKNDNLTKDSVPQSSLGQVVDSLKVLGYHRMVLSKAVEKLEKGAVTKTGVNNKEASSLSKRLTRKNLSPNDLKALKEDIGKENAFNLRQKFNLPFITEKCNPWDTLSEFREPGKNIDHLNYQFFLCNNCSQYGSFVITNTHFAPQKFYFKVSNNASINSIELYNIPDVPSLYYDMIPDPLVEVKDSITINPGVSELFLFKITGMKSESTPSSIIISSADKTVRINIKKEILDSFIENNFESLNVNVWAYLNKPMLINHKEEAVKDLKLHHVNTLVIPPEILPGMATTDFNSFDNYLSNFGEIKNILLSMGYGSLVYRRGLKNGKFMSDEWKKDFIQWYSNIKKLIHDNGFSNSQIYLYPYDEVVTRNFEDFKQLISWSREAIPGIKFYATLNTQESIDSLLSFVDIAQILPSLASRKLPAHHCEIWIYTGNTPSRALSPYGFYRLMAWDAFVNNYHGIGFWNYADERNGNALNLVSDVPNTAGSYSVIYNNPDGSIISSRRWEAFRLGIEDYSILQAYSKKYGIEPTRALAKRVVDKPDNLNLADSVRNLMITSLIPDKK